MDMFLDAEAANKALDGCRSRAAALEIGFRAAVRLCHLRRSGFCYVDCKAMVLCDAKDMKLLTWVELPSEFRELVKPDYVPNLYGPPTENEGRSRYDPEEDGFQDYVDLGKEGGW